VSLVIEGGAIVAADRTWKADVLVDGEIIQAIGDDLSRGDSWLDAAGCLVMPGGIATTMGIAAPQGVAR